MRGEKFNEDPNTTILLPTEERHRNAIYKKREEYKKRIADDTKQGDNFGLTVRIRLIDVLANEGVVDIDKFTDDFIQSEARLRNPDDESGFREEIFFAGLAVKAYCEGNTEHLTGGTGLSFE